MSSRPDEMMQAALPDVLSALRLDGLDGPVEIFRDTLGAPHARAGTVHDAFFAQGFVHAQDRLWQMEYDRRRAAGRLAEYLGPPAVVMDVFCRRLGLDPSARRDYEALDADTRAMLDAYATGVNAFLEHGPLPVELQLLEAAPEPWQPWHCGAVFKGRHVLMGTMDVKLWRSRVLRALGSEATAVLASAHGTRDTVIVPVGGEVDVDLDPSLLGAGVSAAGSNSWAVHGDRTASGLPLMAGDPHRSLEVPNVYYQNHIACPDFDVIGLSMPGVPGMFHFGHNARVAWCVTHAMADTQDLYVERFDTEGRYEYRGEWLDAEQRTEVLHVRDAPSVEVEVTTTHHGPVVLGDPASGTAITLCWTATDGANTTLRSVRRMLSAASVDELDDAMRFWIDPCNSFLMADVDATIAYLHRGRVPVRSRANGWAPVPGWTGEHEWEGDIPFAELPRLRNPDAGYIVTANNRIWGTDRPHYLGMDYAGPSRARRILARLAGIDGATAEDMAAVHADRVSLPAQRFVEVLRDIGVADELRPYRDLLCGWTGEMDPDAAAPGLYTAFRLQLAELLREREPLSRVDEPGPEEPDPTPVLTRIRWGLLRLQGDHPALRGGASWEELAGEALRRAAAVLEDRLGPDPAGWRWGRLHTTAIVHPLSALFPDAADALDPPAVGCGGDGDTVQVSGAELGFGVEHSSVARYVFDLADWDRSAWVIPFGSSGHPASPHYADQADAWAEVRLHPMTYSWERIAQGAESAQRLEPR